jgi:hypothetical protein
MIPPLIVAVFLVAHGLIHASFVSPRPPATAGGPQWPFDLSQSWALSPLGLEAGASRVIGMVLLAVVLGGFVVAGLSVAGIAPASVFVGAVAVGAVASIVMLALFFHPWLVLGVVIDVVLLWATLAASWRPGQAAIP